MRKLLRNAIAIGLGMAASAPGAHAYTMLQATGNTNGSSFDAVADANGFIAATKNVYAAASFTYTGPLNFRVGPPQNSTSAGDLNSTFYSNGTITNYARFGSTTLPAPANVNFATLGSFLASSGSASNFQYGSFLAIDLGTLTIGTVLTISHDDGASVFQNNARVGSTTAGPTGEITETVRLTDTADTLIFYSRQNGAPSVLNVAVPEPASMALLGAGLAGLGFVRRRKA